MPLTDRKAIAALEYLSVRGFYSTAYNELVQPDRVFAVTDYFRRYWVPLLKPGPAWLVVALRQRCYWNGQRTWCTVSRDTLAEDCGCSTRTVDNYFTLPLVDWFVSNRQARYTVKADGQKQRDWTRYTLRLDEPLTPAHQAALAALAAELALDCQSEPPADRALAIANRLLALEPEELWQRLDERTGRLEDWKAGRLESCAPRTVQDIIEQATQSSDLPSEGASQPSSLPASQSSDLPLSRACDALYLRIIRPDKVLIATQYFRLRWLPLLGAARAWLILHLRARCYLNARQLEVRDTCTVAGLGELAAMLGVSLSTVKTCLAEPPAGAFLSHLATHRPGAGQVQMVFRVEMIDPLTPADHTQDPSRFPGHDQQLNSAGSSSEQQPDFAGSPSHQEPEFAGGPGQRPDFAGSAGQQEPNFAAAEAGAKSQILQDTKVPESTLVLPNTQQQAVISDDLLLAAAIGSLGDLLVYLGIEEPIRSRLVQLNPPLTTAFAWALEALGQDRITNKPGFIVSMLLGGYAPPPDLEQLSGLSVGRWRELVRSLHITRVAGLEAAPCAGDPHFQLLYDRLGHLAADDWPSWLPQAPVDSPDVGDADDEPPPDLGIGSPSALARQGRVLPEPGGNDAELGTLWACALDLMRGQMLPANFYTYLHDTHLAAIDGDRWIVAAPYPYIRDRLRAQFAPTVRKAATQVAGRAVEVEFVVD